MSPYDQEEFIQKGDGHVFKDINLSRLLDFDHDVKLFIEHEPYSDQPGNLLKETGYIVKTCGVKNGVRGGIWGSLLGLSVAATYGLITGDYECGTALQDGATFGAALGWFTDMFQLSSRVANYRRDIARQNVREVFRRIMPDYGLPPQE